MNIIFVENFNFYKKRSKIKTVGGIETNTLNIIKELRERGHSIWMPSKETEPEWVKKGEVDLIAGSTFDPLTYLQVKKFKSKFSQRAGVVMHAHTTVEDLKGNFLPDKPIFNDLLKLWLRILYGVAHLVITPSYYSKKCIENIQSSMTYPIYAVSNGIRIDEFKKVENYGPNFRQFLNDKYGVPLKATIIINVGLSWKKKRVDIFGRIAKALPDYYFVWVGPKNKNPDIGEVLKLKNVIFTGFYDDIREPYYGADLFLNTSEVENQGIPLIEAAICKLPIVASNLPAYDWIKHNEGCIKANNLSDYIEGIEKMLGDVNFKKKIIDNAYSKAIELHDFNKIGDKIIKLYRKAIKIKKIWDQKRFKK